MAFEAGIESREIGETYPIEIKLDQGTFRLDPVSGDAAGEGAETVGGGGFPIRAAAELKGPDPLKLPLTRRLLGEETENGYTVLSSDVDLAIDHEWRDELVSVSEGVATACSLVAVVKLVLQIGGVVGV